MKLLCAVCVLVTFSTTALADVKIAMRPGSQCWSYLGWDTRFFGNFAAGQEITVAVVEEQRNDKGAEVVAYDAKSIWVNGPKYFRSANEENNDRVILAEKSGEYIFNLMEHGTGKPGDPENFVRICARKK